MADVRKPEGTSNDGFQTVQRKDFRGPLGSKKGTVDNEKPMDDLVDDTRKKMEAPPKKTPYLAGDDMDFDDMGPWSHGTGIAPVRDRGTGSRFAIS
ncbi:hypothetical protein Tco_1369174 [Tanacetum coccineum]